MRTWVCKYDLGFVGECQARGVFCDFGTFSSFNFAVSRILTGFPVCK